jgi:RNA polymerase sigma-B factor
VETSSEVTADRHREEQQAFARLHAGVPGARDELVARYLPLVKHLARRYGRGLEPLEDLVQVGSIGLLNAIDRFDTTSGTAFSSFAVPTILGEIRRHFRDRTWTIRVPRSLKDLAAVSREAEEEFELREGRIPTAGELAAVLDVDVERLLEARLAAAAQYPDSLDRPLTAGEDDGASVQERVAVADRDLAEMEDGASLEMLTSGLGARDRELLRLRFEEDLTQSDIADRVGLSQMHVSRLLRDALAKLGDELGEADALNPAA